MKKLNGDVSRFFLPLCINSSTALFYSFVLYIYIGTHTISYGTKALKKRCANRKRDIKPREKDTAIAYNL